MSEIKSAAETDLKRDIYTFALYYGTISVIHNFFPQVNSLVSPDAAAINATREFPEGKRRFKQNEYIASTFRGIITFAHLGDSHAHIRRIDISFT